MGIKRKTEYVTIRIPRGLAEEIDRVIEAGTHGYRSRAELVNEAVRIHLRSMILHRVLIKEAGSGPLVV